MINTVLNFNIGGGNDQQEEKTYRMSECQLTEPITPILNQIYQENNKSISSESSSISTEKEQRILIVDDEVYNIMSMNIMIQASGYSQIQIDKALNG